MEYTAEHADWELTMGCNMRCRHCGSSCRKPLAGQLTTTEALRLSGEIAELGIKRVTLTGGEPLTRTDWHLIAQSLRKNNVIPDLMTNGWLLSSQVLDQAAAVGIDTIIVSLDGDHNTHDIIRRQGSYDRVMDGLNLMKVKGIRAEVITVVHRLNLDQLHDIYNAFKYHNVTTWRINLALPVGNFAQHSDKILDQAGLNQLEKYIHEFSSDGVLTIRHGECHGYYGNTEGQHTDKIDTATTWNGCRGGKERVGILHNGDIIGCYHIRDQRFIEGNIRETPLGEIWRKSKSFAWNREATEDKLTGLCGACKYRNGCLGGCSNLRVTMNNSLMTENRYCSYNQALFQAWRKIETITDVDTSATMGKDLVKEGEVQLAQMLLKKAMALQPDNIELLSYYSYTSYLLNDWAAARQANKRILSLDPEHVYANEGMGVISAKQGKMQEAVNYLCKAAKGTTDKYMTPYYDLVVLLAEKGRLRSALKVVKEAEKKAPGFKQKYLRGTLPKLHDAMSTQE